MHMHMLFTYLHTRIRTIRMYMHMHMFFSYLHTRIHTCAMNIHVYTYAYMYQYKHTCMYICLSHTNISAYETRVPAPMPMYTNQCTRTSVGHNSGDTSGDITEGALPRENQLPGTKRKKKKVSAPVCVRYVDTAEFLPSEERKLFI